LAQATDTLTQTAINKRVDDVGEIGEIEAVEDDPDLLAAVSLPVTGPWLSFFLKIASILHMAMPDLPKDSDGNIKEPKWWSGLYRWLKVVVGIVATLNNLDFGMLAATRVIASPPQSSLTPKMPGNELTKDTKENDQKAAGKCQACQGRCSE